MQDSGMKRVAVLGAGYAGLTAAQVLGDAAIETAVFEKKTDISFDRPSYEITYFNQFNNDELYTNHENGNQAQIYVLDHDERHRSDGLAAKQ